MARTCLSKFWSVIPAPSSPEEGKSQSRKVKALRWFSFWMLFNFVQRLQALVFGDFVTLRTLRTLLNNYGQSLKKHTQSKTIQRLNKRPGQFQPETWSKLKRLGKQSPFFAGGEVCAAKLLLQWFCFVLKKSPVCFLGHVLICWGEGAQPTAFEFRIFVWFS